MTKKYSTADLNPETTFERHIFHRINIVLVNYKN